LASASEPDSASSDTDAARAVERSRLAVDRLSVILASIDPVSIDPVEFLDVMATIGEVLHEFDNSAREMGRSLELTSAKDRIRAFLLAHVGEVVNTYQLNGVSGIQESPRRIRELRVEEGMQISAGPTEGLRSGEYRLDAVDANTQLARRWRLRIQVRRSGGSIKDRCLLLLRQLYPEPASKGDLAYVAKKQEWPRRMRELEEEGWAVISKTDDPSMSVGSYRLGSLEKGQPRSRQAIKQRTAILQRDQYTCGDCGASPTTVRGTVLQVHHLHQVHLGGKNADDNLVTLCSNCHAGRHANDDARAIADDLLDPSLDPWAES